MKRKHARLSRRTTGFFVSVVYLFTNVFFAPGFVRNASAQTSAIPATADFWRSRAQALPQGIGAHLPSKSFPILNPLLKSLSPFLNIQSVRVGGAQAPTVLLIQDVHMNADAQVNIGRGLLKIIGNDPKNVLVAAEAANGLFAFARYRRYPDARVTKEIADSFLRDNLISAVSWLGLVAPEPLPLVLGVDDDSLYRANVDAFKKTAALKEKTRADLARTIRSLEAQKPAALSPEAARLYDRIIAYQKGMLPIADHIAVLARILPLDSYPNLKKLVAAVDLEKSIKTLQAKRQPDRILQAYERYLALADGIRHDELFRELNAAARAAVEKVARTVQEKELMTRLLRARLTEKLVNFELTPEEWKDLSEPSQAADLKPFEQFYRLAEARNEKIIANLFGGLARHRKKTAVVVVGGFHTPGLARLLEAKGASVVLLSPKIERLNVIQGSAYLNVFLRDRAPLSKLFESGKLTLGDAGLLLGAPSFGGRRTTDALALAYARKAASPEEKAAVAAALGVPTNAVQITAGPDGETVVTARGVTTDIGPRVSPTDGQFRIGAETNGVHVHAKSPRLLFLAGFIAMALRSVSDQAWMTDTFHVIGLVFFAWTAFECLRFGWGLWRGRNVTEQDFYRVLRHATELKLIPRGAEHIVKPTDGNWFRAFQAAGHMYDPRNGSTIHVRMEFAYSITELARMVRHELYHQRHQAQAPPPLFRFPVFDHFILTLFYYPFLDFFQELIAQITEWNVHLPVGDLSMKHLFVEKNSLDQNPLLNDVVFLKSQHAQIKNELSQPGSGQMRKIIAISDQHGTIDKFDALLLDSMRSILPDGLIPADFRLDPDQLLNEQFRRFSFNLNDLQGKIFFHNLGDFMDRGPYGIKIYRRSKELIDAGISDFIIGNHDFWMFMNLAAVHLPWYEGFKFWGEDEPEDVSLINGNGGATETPYSDAYDSSYGTVEGAVSHFRQVWTGTENELKAWWAQRLGEYTQLNKKKQERHWSNYEKKINGDFEADGKTRVKGTGLFAKVSPSLTKETHKKLWNQLRGWYLVELYRGVRDVSGMSVKWWEELLADFKRTFEQEIQPDIHLASDSDETSLLPSQQAWVDAIAMMEEMSAELKDDLERDLSGGKWWVRAFEAVNYKNYTSAEWWAKDWRFHDKWGTEVMKELNKLNRAQNPLAPEVNDANYLSDPTLKEIAAFFKEHFTLYRTDEYFNTYMHAFLPVDMETGEFFFTYKGHEYRGKGKPGFRSVWEGMDRITKDVREAKSLAEMNEALKLVNSWYADNKTVIKPPNVAAAINKFGPAWLAKINGFNRLFMGHIPFHEFFKLSQSEPSKLGIISGFAVNDVVFFTDHGKGERFDGRGGYVAISANGIQLHGYEDSGSQVGSAPIVVNPKTVKVIGMEKQVLFRNAPVDRTRFLLQLDREYKKRIETLLPSGSIGPSSFFYYLTGSKTWGIVGLLFVEIPAIVTVRYFLGPSASAFLLYLLAICHVHAAMKNPIFREGYSPGFSLLSHLAVFAVYVAAPVQLSIYWAFIPVAVSVAVDACLLFVAPLIRKLGNQERSPVSSSVAPDGRTENPTVTDGQIRDWLTIFLSKQLNFGMNESPEREAALEKIVQFGDQSALELLEKQRLNLPEEIIEETAYDGHVFTATVKRRPNPERVLLEEAIMELRQRLQGPKRFSIPWLKTSLPRVNNTPYGNRVQFFNAPKLNESLLRRLMRDGRIDIEKDIPSPLLAGFLGKLREHIKSHPDSALRYLVVMGGSVGKTILMQDRDARPGVDQDPNDLDLTLKLDLTAEELADVKTSGVIERGLLADKIMERVETVLSELAVFMGVTKEDLEQGKASYEGKEVQFLGPYYPTLYTGDLKLLMRGFVDQRTKTMIHAYVTASILHTAIDADGVVFMPPLSGHSNNGTLRSWSAVERLLENQVEIAGFAPFLSLGGLLRAILIEQKWVLPIAFPDFDALVRKGFADFTGKEVPENSIQAMIASVVNLRQQIENRAHSRTSAETRLRELGVHVLAEQLKPADESRQAQWLMTKEGLVIGNLDVQSVDKFEDSLSHVTAGEAQELFVEVKLNDVPDMLRHWSDSKFEGDIVHLTYLPPERFIGVEASAVALSGKAAVPPVALKFQIVKPYSADRDDYKTNKYRGLYLFKGAMSFPAAGKYQVTFRVFNPQRREEFRAKEFKQSFTVEVAQAVKGDELKTIGLADWRNITPSQVRTADVAYYNLADLLSADSDPALKGTDAFGNQLKQVARLIAAESVILAAPEGRSIEDSRAKLKHLLTSHGIAAPANLDRLPIDRSGVPNPFRAARTYYVRIHALPVYGYQSNWDFTDSDGLRNVLIEIVNLATGKSLVVTEEILRKLNVKQKTGSDA